MDQKNEPKKELIHQFSSKNGSTSPMAKQVLFTVVIVLLLGVGTGYIASSVSGDGRVEVTNSSPSEDEIKEGSTFGVSDTKAFPDTAEGVVKEGGIDGEGEYHLVRPGGDSQNVYMTSSVVDLSKFVGKEIKVWGSTQTARTAGWLMDVGKVEVK